MKTIFGAFEKNEELIVLNIEGNPVDYSIGKLIVHAKGKLQGKRETSESIKGVDLQI